ncbi:hypothetical protein TOPH_08418 [Tolypocladium ophioglossoides CBS 100239]|uniref:S-adenosyl-L-methionine-dependent methyltransferase n=1 Tax=Tolypocladium ophioglossoides (strain CBS 100239) TaxID=1163406 RepID=A0A0L0MYP7_TOLOC|nr:hypothetical protein TOPH_08418 [Tolypocladium ophioglossoides CBS 100239]
MYYALLEKRRFLAPITKSPQWILDIGCGTGIWAVDVADEYPSAEVESQSSTCRRREGACHSRETGRRGRHRPHTAGLVSRDVPSHTKAYLSRHEVDDLRVPPNCSFEIDDVEQLWTWKESTADLIFGRDLFLSIRNFPRLIDQCYRHLKPGGWLELQCVTGTLRCDDGTVPKDSAYQRMEDYVGQACEKFGTPVDDPLRWKGWMQERGFEDVVEEVFKLPTAPWAADKRLKLVGMWEQHQLLNNVDGMIMRLFHKALGWTEQEITVFGAMFRKDLRNLNMHAYYP